MHPHVMHVFPPSFLSLDPKCQSSIRHPLASCHKGTSHFLSAPDRQIVDS